MQQSPAEYSTLHQLVADVLRQHDAGVTALEIAHQLQAMGHARTEEEVRAMHLLRKRTLLPVSC